MLTKSDPSRVTVVTVSFNSLRVLPAMLASLPNRVATVIVDNGSADSGALKALAAAHGARLILNPENRGFGAACNQGAAGIETEFFLFLNPDTVLGAGAISELVAAIDRFPEAAAMNPRIENAEGGPDFKRGSVLLPRSDWLPRGWPAEDCDLPVLSGAALFVRRSAFEVVQGFDPAIFLYHEDDDLSLRLKARCGKLMFIRAAVVLHQGGGSSIRSPEVAALKAWHMGRSRVYAMRRHGRPMAFAGALTSALVQVVSPAVLLSRRKRAKQVAFLHGVLSARTDASLKPEIAR